MEVILLESIEGVGRKGALVQVKRGFARNYLLPHHKALPVTKDTMYRLDSLKKRFAVEEAKLLSELKIVAKQLEGVELELEAKATTEGHLYGSISTARIAAALEAKGLPISERLIRLAEPIKAVGTYPVTIRLHPDLSVEIQVLVAPEGGVMPEAAEAAAATGDGEGAAAEGGAQAEPAVAEGGSAEGAGQP